MNVGNDKRHSGTLEREDWNGRYAAQELIWSADANRFVVEEAAGLRPGTALDLAAGEGRNAIWFAEHGWLVRAVDFSSAAIEKGKRFATSRKVHGKVEFREADLRSYEPEAYCYDLVAMIYFQVPQATLVPILKRAAKAVAPGGTFLLVAHDSSNLEHGYGGPQNPQMLYTADEVVVALGGDLRIEKATRVERPV